jgi:hypothetical protein
VTGNVTNQDLGIILSKKETHLKEKLQKIQLVKERKQKQTFIWLGLGAVVSLATILIPRVENKPGINAMITASQVIGLGICAGSISLYTTSSFDSLAETAGVTIEELVTLKDEVIETSTDMLLKSKDEFIVNSKDLVVKVGVGLIATRISFYIANVVFTIYVNPYIEHLTNQTRERIQKNALKKNDKLLFENESNNNPPDEDLGNSLAKTPLDPSPSSPMGYPPLSGNDVVIVNECFDLAAKVVAGLSEGHVSPPPSNRSEIYLLEINFPELPKAVSRAANRAAIRAGRSLSRVFLPR